MSSGIYQIRNVLTGHVYVGSAKSFFYRFRAHIKLLRRGRHHSRLLQSAWNEYGSNGFVFEKLEIVPNEADLIVREQFWLDALRAANANYGYNILPVAGSLLGHKLSDETKAKMSASAKGRIFTAEHRAKIAAARRGKPLSPEHAAKARTANVGRVFSQEVRDRMSASRKGRTHSPEAIAKMSAAQRGKKKSPEHVAKWRAAMGAKSASGELSEIAKRRWARLTKKQRSDLAKRVYATRRINAAAAHPSLPL